MSLQQIPFTCRDRVAGKACDTIRRKSPGFKLAVRAALAAQTFPNDRFIRQPRREEQPLPEFTPERNRKMLALAYSLGPKPIIMPRKPSRREAIMRRRVAEKDLRKTMVADHPLGVREALAGKDTGLGIVRKPKTVHVLGNKCKVHPNHLFRNRLKDIARKGIAQDLSVNAVAARKAAGLTALDPSPFPRASA